MGGEAVEPEAEAGADRRVAEVAVTAGADHRMTAAGIEECRNREKSE